MGTIALGTTVGAAPAPLSNVLTLGDYLGQVRTLNTGVQAQSRSAEGSGDRSTEASLATSPQLLASASLSANEQLPQNALFSWDRQTVNAYSLGVAQQFKFGLYAQVAYNLSYTGLLNMRSGTTNLGSPHFYDAVPQLSVKMPLWSGGFGRSVLAAQEATEAQALATSYGSRFAIKGSLAQAESTYWRLALARTALGLATENLERAQKTYQWSSRRANLQLADTSDALQAEALLKIRQLELQAARDELRSAARAFNSARSVNSDEVSERLQDFAQIDLANLKAPARAEVRDDVRAAAQQQRAASASARLAKERNSPQLDLSATYALNGRSNNSTTESMANVTSAHRETKSVALSFKMPFDAFTLARAHSGAELERLAADLQYERKVFENEQEWIDLTHKLDEAKNRTLIAMEIEKTQRAKLDNERLRYQRGRSTTFQVLQFEQDYSSAQLNRLRLQTEVLSVVAQLKTFGDSL